MTRLSSIIGVATVWHFTVFYKKKLNPHLEKVVEISLYLNFLGRGNVVYRISFQNCPGSLDHVSLLVPLIYKKIIKGDITHHHIA